MRPCNALFFVNATSLFGSEVARFGARAGFRTARLTLLGRKPDGLVVVLPSMPAKLVYDDDCRVCTWSATFAVRRGNIQPIRLSRVRNNESRLTDEERARLPEGYEECAQLVAEDAVYSCGSATEQSLVLAGTLPASLVGFLRRFETYARLRETLYHFLSDNRDIVAHVISREPPVSDHIPSVPEPPR